MPESAVRAERFDSSSSLPSYTWEVSGKPVVARIGLEMIDRLEQEVVENFRSLNSRGSEIGGLLLGSVQPGSPLRVNIENYELIACDYSRGPLYRFSEADVERFDRALQQRAAAGNQRVVGFFRSHTRKGLALDAEDIAFFTGHFRDAHQVALLVRPYASKPSTAGIFIWENGAIRGDASHQEFPFRRSELESNSGTQPPAEREQPAPAASVEPTATRQTVRAQIVPIASRREITLPSNPQLSTQTEIPKPVDPPAAEKVSLHRTPEKAMPVQKTSSPVTQKSSTESSMPVPKAPESSSPVPPSSSPKFAAAERSASTEKPVIAEKSPAAEKPAIAEKSEATEKPSVSDKTAVSEKPAAAEKPVPAEKAQTADVSQKSPQSSLAEKAAPIPKFTSGFDSSSTNDADETETPRSGSKKLMWLAGGAAAALVLLSGVLIYPGMLHKSGRNTSGSGADPSGLSLRVERSAGELLLSWNRDSEALKNAAHASLSIHDGQQNENVDLDMSQLRNGSIVYSPSSSDVVFQLSVVGKDSSKIESESVRILRTRPSPMDTPGNEANSATQAKGSNANTLATPAGSMPAPPPANQPAATAGDSEKTETPEETTAPTKAPLKPFQAEGLSQRLRPVRPSDLPDAPRLTATQQVAVNLPGTNLLPPAPAPAAPLPPSQPAAKLGGQVTTAVLVTRVNPDYPAAARQSRVQGSVLVSAIVGADGHVKSAKAISGHPLLESSAVNAVRQWVYKPALLNGNPVESEMRVELNFTLGR